MPDHEPFCVEFGMLSQFVFSHQDILVSSYSFLQTHAHLGQPETKSAPRCECETDWSVSMCHVIDARPVHDIFTALMVDG